MTQNLKAQKCLSQYLEKNVELILQGTILGHLPSGKNQYGISKKSLYKQAPIVGYEKDFLPQAQVLKNKYKIRQPLEDIVVGIYAKIYFRDYRRDVDLILFCDLLQKSLILKNDRIIRVKFIDGIHVDKVNPRIEFELYDLHE